MVVQDMESRNLDEGDDLLSIALGSKDRLGLIRAVGRGITKSQYFNNPTKCAESTMEEKQLDRVGYAGMAAC